jgi:hypothetical protein
MIKKPTKSKSDKRKLRDREPAEKPVSLKPLTVEEALRGLMETRPSEKNSD